MERNKRLIELGEALRMVQNSKDDCPETSIKGRAIWETAHNCALSCLTSCPAVEAVEVVHGRWIDEGGLDEDGNGQYRCSHCGVGEKHNPTVTVSYCWNCGAKMDGGNEDA